MIDIQEKYKKEAIPKLKEFLGVKNTLALPQFEKVVINIGIGKMMTKNAQTAKQSLETVNKIITLITGQKPLFTKAKQSIAGFKIRENMVIGMKVTLRGKKMYDFLNRWINIAIPRTRDFRGVEVANIDSDGNLNFGVKEYTVFPEVANREEKGGELFGFQITVVLKNVKKRDQAIGLYKAVGFPLKTQ